MPADFSSKERAKLIRQIGLALQLPMMLVAPIVVGALIGYFLDGWLHTRPIVMVVLIMLGFAVGLRDTLKSISKEEKRDE